MITNYNIQLIALRLSNDKAKRYIKASAKCMREDYLIHNTHRTFRAWLFPFSFIIGQPSCSVQLAV